MQELLVASTALTLVFLLIGFMLLIAPLMIWSHMARLNRQFKDYRTQLDNHLADLKKLCFSIATNDGALASSDKVIETKDVPKLDHECSTCGTVYPSSKEFCPNCHEKNPDFGW